MPQSFVKLQGQISDVIAVIDDAATAHMGLIPVSQAYLLYA
jgi:hypothetical protein